MKISNFFMLTGATIIGAAFIWSNLGNQKFIPKEELSKNFLENKSSFEKNLYNYKATAFEQPFDEILIVDTSSRQQPNEQNPWQSIQLIPSERYGIKSEAYGNYGESNKIEDKKLILYRNSDYRMSRLLLIYAPYIKKISVRNAFVNLEELETDSITFEVKDGGHLALESKNTLRNIQVNVNQGSCTVKSMNNLLGNVNVQLANGSFFELQVDSCAVFAIDADSSSSVRFGPPINHKNERMTAQAYLGKLAYNDAIKEIKLSYSEIIQLQGDVQKLVLDMPYEQIQKNTAVILSKNH